MIKKTNLILTTIMLVLSFIIISQSSKSHLQKELEISYRVNRIMENVLKENKIEIKEIVNSNNKLLKEMNSKDNVVFDIIDSENNSFFLILTNNRKYFVLIDNQNNLIHGFVDNALFPNWPVINNSRSN